MPTKPTPTLKKYYAAPLIKTLRSGNKIKTAKKRPSSGPAGAHMGYIAAGALCDVAEAATSAGEKATATRLFEQAATPGGQWSGDATCSGVWPSMRTNTSRVLTQFSDLPHAPGLGLITPDTFQASAVVELTT